MAMLNNQMVTRLEVAVLMKIADPSHPTVIRSDAERDSIEACKVLDCGGERCMVAASRSSRDVLEQ